MRWRAALRARTHSGDAHTRAFTLCNIAAWTAFEQRAQSCQKLPSLKYENNVRGYRERRSIDIA